MNKAELETKHLAELHSLAAAAGVERYRMLTRTELIERLSGDGGSGDDGAAAREPRSQRGGEGGGQRSSRSRSRRRRPAREREDAADGESASEPAESESKPSRESRAESEAEDSRREPSAKREPEPSGAAAEEPDSGGAGESRPRRRRRRRPFGRRGKQQGVTLQGLLLPPESGRQAVLLGESREACTALLRSVAADLAAAAKGPDPVALLIDPSPEELADWKREAPQAEIVAAGQPRHADDALAQASARAKDGEDVILLVDSLTRLGEAYDDAEAAKKFFDAGRAESTSGSLTVVAALERSGS